MKDEASKMACNDRHTKEQMIHLTETWQIDCIGIRVKLNELKYIISGKNAGAKTPVGG